MVYSDVFFCNVLKRRNRLVAIDLLRRFQKRCYMLIFNGVQKLLATFFKTSLYNITFFEYHLGKYISSAFKTSLKLAHYFLTLKMLLYKLAQTNKCPN